MIKVLEKINCVERVLLLLIVIYRKIFATSNWCPCLLVMQKACICSMLFSIVRHDSKPSNFSLTRLLEPVKAKPFMSRFLGNLASLLINIRRSEPRIKSTYSLQVPTSCRFGHRYSLQDIALTNVFY